MGTKHLELDWDNLGAPSDCKGMRHISKKNGVRERWSRRGILYIDYTSDRNERCTLTEGKRNSDKQPNMSTVGNSIQERPGYEHTERKSGQTRHVPPMLRTVYFPPQIV